MLGNLDELPEGTQTAAYLDYARRAAAVAERILYLGNGFEKFARGTRQSGLAPGRLQSCRDVYQAAAELAPELAPGTVILIKGSHRQKLGRIRLLLARGRGALRPARLPADRPELPALPPISKRFLK